MSEENRRDAYLWDPAAPPDKEVEALEKGLGPTRFALTRKPLSLPAPAPARSWWLPKPVLAAAASLVLLVGVAYSFWWWRWSWPAGQPWAISRPQPGNTAHGSLRVDEPVRIDAATQVRIARIGSMDVQPGSSLTLVESTTRRHRVLLEQGSVSVRVWAPPGRFAFNTPAGTVLDMGCVFDLTVDAEGASRVTVRTGWVELENGWGEVLVPAGASSVMTAAARPGVPVFDDAKVEFLQSVRDFEGAADETARARLISAVTKAARKRDVYSLLLLARFSPEGYKRPLLERAAELVPPPSAGDVEAILGGDLDKLWAWKETLGLPPPKSWWLNWQDAFPL